MALRSLQARLKQLQSDDEFLCRKERQHQKFQSSRDEFLSSTEAVSSIVTNLNRTMLNSLRRKNEALFNVNARSNHSHRRLLDRYVPAEEPSTYRHAWTERVTTPASIYVSCNEELVDKARRYSAYPNEVVDALPRERVRAREERLRTQRVVETDNNAARKENERLKAKLEVLHRPRTAAASVRPTTAATKVDSLRSSASVTPTSTDLAEKKQKPRRENSPDAVSSSFPRQMRPRPATATSQPPTATASKARPTTAASLRAKIARLEDSSVSLYEHFPPVAAVDESDALDVKLHTIVDRGDFAEATLLRAKYGEPGSRPSTAAARAQGRDPSLSSLSAFSVHDRLDAENKFAFDFLEETERELSGAIAEAERKVVKYRHQREALNLRRRCAVTIQRGYRRWRYRYMHSYAPQPAVVQEGSP